MGVVNTQFYTICSISINLPIKSKVLLFPASKMSNNNLNKILLMEWNSIHSVVLTIRVKKLWICVALLFNKVRNLIIALPPFKIFTVLLKLCHQLLWLCFMIEAYYSMMTRYQNIGQNLLKMEKKI